MNRKLLSILISSALSVSAFTTGNVLAFEQNTTDAIAKDYQQHLAPLWDHFHRNPELSLMETKTAKRLAQELSAVGYEVTQGVGGTGIVAMLKNGAGPMVMVRADMDLSLIHI